MPNPSPTTDPDYCQSMVGSGPEQIPDALTAYGLRTVDGSCNNLIPGRAKFAAADQPFRRYTSRVLSNAEPITESLPVGPEQLVGYDALVSEMSAEDEHAQDHPFWLLTVAAGQHAATATIEWTTEALGVLDDLTARQPVAKS